MARCGSGVRQTQVRSRLSLEGGTQAQIQVSYYLKVGDVCVCAAVLRRFDLGSRHTYLGAAFQTPAPDSSVADESGRIAHESEPVGCVLLAFPVGRALWFSLLSVTSAVEGVVI